MEQEEIAAADWRERKRRERRAPTTCGCTGSGGNLPNIVYFSLRKIEPFELARVKGIRPAEMKLPGDRLTLAPLDKRCMGRGLSIICIGSNRVGFRCPVRRGLIRARVAVR